MLLLVFYAFAIVSAVTLVIAFVINAAVALTIVAFVLAAAVSFTAPAYVGSTITVAVVSLPL